MSRLPAPGSRLSERKADYQGLTPNYTVVGDLPRLRSIALTDNVPLMTAIGNNQAYADIFVEPLKNLLQAGDILIAISTSGNSPNVVKAVEYAQANGAKVVGFCGHPGGRLAEMANLKVTIPSGRIGHQEDGHMILDHVISAALRERIERSALSGPALLRGQRIHPARES